MNKKLLLLTLAVSGFLFLPATAQEGSRTWDNRHHLGLVLGYVRLVGGNLQDNSQGYDFSNTGHAAISYRYSLNPKLDLSIEGRALAATQTTNNGAELTLTDGFFGPGLRINFPGVNAKPYIQGNLYFANERGSLRGGNSFEVRNGVGVGLNGGVDFRLGRLVSIPVEANYLFGGLPDRTIFLQNIFTGQINTVSRSAINGFGFSAGINFNFGRLYQP